MRDPELLTARLRGELDTLQRCADIVEANFREVAIEKRINLVEFTARVFTDFETLATSQPASFLAQYVEPDRV